MLDRFVEAKKPDIEKLTAQAETGSLAPIYSSRKKSFSQALKLEDSVALISEFKPASPSLGLISKRSAPEIGQIFKTGGASAISVLTEKDHFLSSLENLKSMEFTDLPLLRKDFLFHPLQIRETASTPASALLLIVGLFLDDPEQLSVLLQQTQEYKMEAVVEVFNKEELQMAKKAKAQIIQVNNRDLKTLQVDLNNSRQLIQYKDPDEVWICASGIFEHHQIEEMGSLGYEACLIGTSIMKHSNPLKKLQELTGK